MNVVREGKECYVCNNEDELIRVRPCMFCREFRTCIILTTVLNEDKERKAEQKLLEYMAMPDPCDFKGDSDVEEQSRDNDSRNDGQPVLDD